MVKEVYDVAEIARKVEKHLDWTMDTITRMRRRDVDDEYLTEDERMYLVLIQLRMRVMLPLVRKLADSLEGRT
jgi:hypothetical protein